MAGEHDLTDDMLAEMPVDRLDAEIVVRLHVVQHNVRAGRDRYALDAAAPAHNA